MSADGHSAITGARLHDSALYQTCFDEHLPTAPDLEPITGYGDFSDEAYADIDWIEVTALEVQCANDNGADLQIIPPGDGISGFNNKGGHLSQVFEAILDACRAGLTIPPHSGS